MNPTNAKILFLSILFVKSRSQNSSAKCLLQTISATHKASSSLALLQESHRNWRNEHTLLLSGASKSMDVLDQFIKQQEESGDHCSARLLESKRVMDGLLKDLKALSSHVDSHEEVLETETENLKVTELSVQAVEKAHTEAITKCKQEKQEAITAVSKYKMELEELDQIAKPSVRYKHVTKLSMPDATEEDSLAMQSAWTHERCLAFLQFTKKHQRHAAEANPQKQRDCDGQRDELQKAFTKAYISTRAEIKNAQAEVKDTTCTDTAEAKKAAEMVPLVTERERASSLIESSTQALSGLSPVLELVGERVEKLSDHIENALTPECAEAKQVSEALEKIRELILLLEECPGRNDFKLEIPSV